MISLKNTIKQSSFYSIGNFLKLTISFFLLPLYALFLEPEDFGVLSLISISTTIITIIISSPVVTALNRYFYNPSYLKHKQRLVFSLFVFSFLQSLIFAAIFFIFSGTISKIIFETENWKGLIKIYSLIILFSPSASIFLALLQIKQKVKFYVFVNLISALIVFTITYVLLKRNFGVYAVAIGTLLNYIIIVLTVLIYFLKNITANVNFRLLSKPLKFSYPLMFSDLSLLLFDSGDRYLINLFMSVKDVGLYDIAYRVSGIFNTVVAAPISKAILPAVFKAEETPNEIRNFLKSFTTYYYIFSMFLALVISLFSRDLISLIMANKAEFVESWKIIPIIIFCNVLHGLGNFVGYGIILKEKSWRVTLNMGITLSLNLLLNFLLIPEKGMYGAAFATLISYLIWTALKIYYSGKYYQLYFDVKKLFLITIITILLFFSASFVSSLQKSILLIISFKLLFCFLYMILFYFSNIISKNEKSMLKKEMKTLKKSLFGQKEN